MDYRVGAMNFLLKWIVVKKMINGEKCDYKNSGLSKEWNELMSSFGFNRILYK